MAAGTPLSAKDAVVRIASTVHYAMEWEVDPEKNFDDTTNFEGGGFGTQIGCIRNAKFRISGWWDSGANPFDTPLFLYDGYRLNTVRLYLGGASSTVYWLFPYADVLNIVHGSKVDQKVNLTINCKNYGTFSYPTGNAS